MRNSAFLEVGNLEAAPTTQSKCSNMMDDEDVAHHPDSCAVNRQNHPVRNVNYLQSDDADDDDDKSFDNVQDDDDDNDDDDDDDDDDYGDDDDGNRVPRIQSNYYEYKDDYSNSQKHPKRKKLKALPPSNAKPSCTGRNPLTDWTEHETLILLDAWAEQFLKQGRKSLKSEEWQEVSEKVSHLSIFERTDTQCRNRLDTLKKKYKKEKMKLSSNSYKGLVSDWVYFKKMDALLSPASSPSVHSCGVDSGWSNGLDETRDRPHNSGSGRSEKRSKNGKDESLKLLADSFRKFSDIYNKIEHGGRQKMAELERMRMDFHRDLELRKRDIFKRAHAEIARIRQGKDNDDDDDDDDDDNDDDRVVSCSEKCR